MKTFRTVALIDDDRDDYEIFSMALAEADPGIQCIYYDSAKEALTWLTQENHPLPDYIFLDLNMPGMSGLQFLEQLKQTTVAHLPVIIYSTSILPLHRDRINELGVFASFVKPFSQKELIKILKEVLEKQSY